MSKYLQIILLFTASLLSCCKGPTRNTDEKQDGENVATGERTNRNCKIFSSINGQPIFSLNDSTIIESVPTSDQSWLKMAVYIKLTHKEFMQKCINKGSTIYDEDNIEIGEALSKINVCNAEAENGMLVGYITGYIQKTDVDQSSTLENKIQNLCNAKKTKTLADFQQIISDYDFIGFRYDSLINKIGLNEEEYDAINGMVEYTIEDSWLADPSLDRLSLIFLNDTLISIVNRKTMELPSVAKIKLPSNRTLLIFKDDNDIKKQLPLFKKKIYEFF